jgi:hypothetical protein
LKTFFTTSLTFSSACLTPLTRLARQWSNSKSTTGFARQLNVYRGHCTWHHCGCGVVVRPGSFHGNRLTLLDDCGDRTGTECRELAYAC